MPIHTTVAPPGNPSRAPAAVDTMLDGTGRKTSSASRPKMEAAASPRAVSPRVIRSENAANCGSNRKNGTSTMAISTSQTNAHRIVAASVSNRSRPR